MEAFVAAIILVGIAVMFRAIKFSAAVLLIVIVGVAFALMPHAGKYSQYIPTWLFVIVAIILGINLLRFILGILFGRSAADGFTGKLLYGIFTPIFRIIGGLLRTIFRIR
ncbi:MAG: hypothetical protein HY754_13230 [Nitrospirae bacterium]|nr:hypothetical protein [Nitrospirota bacterium]